MAQGEVTMPPEPLENDITPTDNPLRIEEGGITQEKVKQEISKSALGLIGLGIVAVVLGSWNITMTTAQHGNDIAVIKSQMAEIVRDNKERDKETKARDEKLFDAIKSTNQIMQDYLGTPRRKP